MGGLIEAVENEDWFVTEPDDLYAVDQAMALQGLFLWMQPPDQAERLVLAPFLSQPPPGSSTSNWTSSP